MVVREAFLLRFLYLTLRALRELGDYMIYRVLIALHTTSHLFGCNNRQHQLDTTNHRDKKTSTYDDGLCFVGKVGMMAPFLPSMNVGDMQLDEGDSNTQ